MNSHTCMYLQHRKNSHKKVCKQTNTSLECFVFLMFSFSEDFLSHFNTLLYWHHSFMLSLSWKMLTFIFVFLSHFFHACRWSEKPRKITSKIEGKNKVIYQSRLKNSYPNTSAPFREERHGETLDWEPVMAVDTTASLADH